MFVCDVWCWCCLWMNFWSLNFSLRFKFWCFNISVDTHLFNPLVKGSGEVIKRLIFFNYFWWKLGRCYLYHCGILWETQCFWYDRNQFKSNLLQLFKYFYFNSLNFSCVVIMVGDAEDGVFVLRLSSSI